MPNIVLKQETKDRLDDIGKKNDTYDDIVNRLFDSFSILTSNIETLTYFLRIEEDRVVELDSNGVIFKLKWDDNLQDLQMLKDGEWCNLKNWELKMICNTLRMPESTVKVVEE